MQSTQGTKGPYGYPGTTRQQQLYQHLHTFYRKGVFKYLSLLGSQFHALEDETKTNCVPTFSSFRILFSPKRRKMFFCEFLDRLASD